MILEVPQYCVLTFRLELGIEGLRGGRWVELNVYYRSTLHGVGAVLPWSSVLGLRPPLSLSPGTSSPRLMLLSSFSVVNTSAILCLQ